MQRNNAIKAGKIDAGYRRRSYLAYSAFLLGAAVLAAHLYFLQFNEELRDHYHQSVTARWESFECPQGKRGNILFCDGSLIAGNQKTARVMIEPMLVRDIHMVANILSGYLGMPPEDILTRFENHNGPGLVLAEGVPVATALEIDREKLRGVFTRYYYERYYPQSDFGAAATVGFAGREPVHRLGLEYTFDQQLSGTDGLIEYRKDAGRKRLPGSEIETIAPLDGTDLVTTLDPEIQLICEDEMRKAIDSNSAEWGCILVMTPDGEIKGAATHPTFDPNDYVEGRIGDQFNVLVHRVVEPGSTVKPILTAYAVDRGWISPQRRFVCNRLLKIDGYNIREAELDHVLGGNDGVPVSEIIIHSSNIGMARVALDLKQDRVLEAFMSMGFFKKTGIELPLENAGFKPYQYEQARHEKKLTWPKITLANAGFGQGLAVTPLQLACAYCVFANGGYAVSPTLVRRELASDESLIEESFPAVPADEILLASMGGIPGQYDSTMPGRRRVLSESTCQMVKEWLAEVVENGTGKRARLELFSAAGKTGTAEVASERGGYQRGAYTASFAGFFPVEEPRYVILAMFCKPRGDYYGGLVAAPVFKQVGDRIAYYERCEPEEVAGES